MDQAPSTKQCGFTCGINLGVLALIYTICSGIGIFYFSLFYFVMYFYGACEFRKQKKLEKLVLPFFQAQIGLEKCEKRVFRDSANSTSPLYFYYILIFFL
jgi:hypothetical protein